MTEGSDFLAPCCTGIESRMDNGERERERVRERKVSERERVCERERERERVYREKREKVFELLTYITPTCFLLPVKKSLGFSRVSQVHIHLRQS